MVKKEAKKKELNLEAPAPKYKAVALVKIPGAKQGETHCSVILTVEGSTITNIETSEPNLKSIAMEQAKINFVKTFMSDEDEDSTIKII
jgi:hypothetical protein